jgi:hypothetical protein
VQARADAAAEIIAAAAPGDTVSVEPGIYPAAVVPPGVSLVAVAGPSETIFRSPGPFVLDLSQATESTVIDGLTLDGQGQSPALVRADSSRAVVRNCVLRGGFSGIRAADSELHVENCLVGDCRNGIFLDGGAGVFRENEIRRCSRGASLVAASPAFSGNLFQENTVAIAAGGESRPRIGGSQAASNEFRGNGTAIRNSTRPRSATLGDRLPGPLEATYNDWGTDCPEQAGLSGPVNTRPWRDPADGRLLEGCPEP